MSYDDEIGPDFEEEENEPVTCWPLVSRPDVMCDGPPDRYPEDWQFAPNEDPGHDAFVVGQDASGQYGVWRAFAGGHDTVPGWEAGPYTEEEGGFARALAEAKETLGLPNEKRQ